MHHDLEHVPRGEAVPTRLREIEAAAADVSVNVNGQSLDDARAEFRKSWQARLERARRQAVFARRVARWLNRATELLVLLGALFGMAYGEISFHRHALGPPFAGALVGALMGAGLVSPLVLGVLLLLNLWKRWMRRIEAEVRELERSQAADPEPMEPSSGELISEPVPAGEVRAEIQRLLVRKRHRPGEIQRRD